MVKLRDELTPNKDNGSLYEGLKCELKSSKEHLSQTQASERRTTTKMVALDDKESC